MMAAHIQGRPFIKTKLLAMSGGAPELTPSALPDPVLAVLRGNPPVQGETEAGVWQRWPDRLEPHRVLPLLYRNAVTRGSLSALPAGIAQRLKAAYVVSWAASVRLERELTGIAAVFGQQGIPFLVLKGPGLSRTIYDDPATRPFDDLDLLVETKDFRRARSLLKSLGYRATTGLGLEHHQEFLKEEKGCKYPVELHRTLNIFPRIGWGLPVREVFERAVEAEVPGSVFRTLHPVHAFLHSALHTFTHHREEIRLIWINDLARMASRLSESDWGELQQTSVRWMARLAVEEGLAMARSWFDARIPAHFSDFSRWPGPSDEEAILWSSLGDQGKVKGLMKLYGSEHFGLFERLQQAYYTVFPPAHVMAKRYPVNRPWMLPLAYGRRWIALLKKSLP